MPVCGSNSHSNLPTDTVIPLPIIMHQQGDYDSYPRMPIASATATGWTWVYLSVVLLEL